MEELRELLQQSGVKGMHWGIRRNSNRDRAGGADGKPDASDKKIPRSSLGRKINSLKRERQWKSVLKEMDSLTTKEIGAFANRLTLENSLKTLSRTKGIGTKKDKEDYHNREHMDDLELSRKVKRLQVKSNLHKQVNTASKEQREFGQKIVQIGGSLGVRYVLSKRGLSTDKFDLFKDVVDVVKNPKTSSDNAKTAAKKALLDAALANVKKRRAK